MPRWAKLSERVGQDGRLCQMAEDVPLAALLFTWSLPAADLYGILPGNAREYHARVCPALRVAGAEVQEAINAQVDAGFLMRYRVGDKPLLYIRAYHKYQDVRWRRVGPPEHPLPPEWRIPRNLRELLETPGDSGSIRECSDYGLCVEDGDLSVELHGVSVETPGDSVLDVDVDVDVDTDVDVDKNDSLSDAAAPDPEPEPTTEEKLATLRQDIPQEHLDLIDEYLDNAALENKTNRITPGRRVNETRDLLKLREEVGAAAWEHGMRAANKACAPNINYVKKAADNDRGNLFERSPVKKPKKLTPEGGYGKTRVGWEHLDEVMEHDN